MTHVVIVLLGLWLLFTILRSMVRIALMNRHSRDMYADVTARAVHMAVTLRLRRAVNIHPVLVWIFPAYMLALIFVYFLGAMIAFALLYWGTHAVDSWHRALIASGSALNTLGFATPMTTWGQWLAIPEGALGLGIVVFLFTFIPSYQAVIRSREDKTSWLYVRAGDRPSAITLLEWCQRAGIGGHMGAVWESWEDWFRMLADTHSVLPMLTVSPSVQHGQSWVLAAAVVLDAAALAASSLDSHDGEAARICLRTGTRALLAIADALGRANPAPEPLTAHPSLGSYEAARARLCSAGLPMKLAVERENQWREFLSFRQEYQEALFFIARRTFAGIDQVLVDYAWISPASTRPE